MKNIFITDGVRHFMDSAISFVESYNSSINITAPELGKKHGFNHRIIVPVLNKLMLAGIVKSQVGGRNQGYSLARSPKEITILNILLATVMPPKVECKKRHLTKDGGDCIICGIFNKGIDLILKEYDKITLYDYSKMLNNVEKERLIENNITKTNVTC